MEGPLSPAIETDPELLADGDNLDQQDKITVGLVVIVASMIV